MTDDAIEASAQRVKRKYDTQTFALLTEAWGENLHMGLFERPDESFDVASARATDVQAREADLRKGQRIVETACGIGGTARHLARVFGVRVEATNISEAQIEKARELNAAAGLADMITVGYADFHELPYEARAFDGYWCQEAMLYAADKRRILSEAARVTRSGGPLVLSDLVFIPGAPDAFYQGFMKRLSAHHLWTIAEYDDLIVSMGFTVVARHDRSAHVAPTFTKVLDRFVAKYDRNVALVGKAEIDEVVGRMTMQRDAARDGRLGWLTMVLRAP
jgi:sarcosine/dimethylglycine N-methyltransferase